MPPTGRKAQTITLTKQLKKSSGVNTGSLSSPAAITYEGDGLFRFSSPWWDEDEVQPVSGESAFPLASDVSITGGLETYFTLVDEPWLVSAERRSTSRPPQLWTVWKSAHS